MKKTNFLKLMVFGVFLLFVLTNVKAAYIVEKRGTIIQKDLGSLVMETHEDISFWKALFKFFQYGKVKYVVFNKTLTEVKKSTGSIFNNKKEVISFDDLKVGEIIIVSGELTKLANKTENGEISANNILVFRNIREEAKSPANLDPSALNQQGGEAVSTGKNQWQNDKLTVVTNPEVYKSLTCADDGEPILKVGEIVFPKPPTECCKGLQLCGLDVNDNNNSLNYRGWTAIIIGYCKESCPSTDSSSDLLPGATKTRTGFWGFITSLFTVKEIRECYKDLDCSQKYCNYTNNQLNTISCNYTCNTDGKCINGFGINKTQCEDSNECGLNLNNECVLVGSGMGNGRDCACLNGKCQVNPESVTTTTMPNVINTTCKKNADCGWCNFNCVTGSEKENLKTIGVTCNEKAKVGYKCTCMGTNCQAVKEDTPPTSFGEPYKPELPELPTPITTTTKSISPTTTVRKITTETTLYGDCMQPVCGDGICHEWEKKSDSVLGTCYCLLNSGMFKTKAYSSLVGHVVCDNGGLNRNFCIKDCDGSYIYEEPTTTTTTTLPPAPELPVVPSTTVTTSKAVSNPVSSPVDILLNGFCGGQTSSSCTKDSDCRTAGCSGEVCQSVTDKNYVSTCDWKSCFKKPANIYCGCRSGKCQWYEAKSTTVSPSTLTPPTTLFTTPSITVSGNSTNTFVTSPTTSCIYLGVMVCKDGVLGGVSSCDPIEIGPEIPGTKCYDYLDLGNNRCQCR